MTAENRGCDNEHEPPQPKFELGQLVGTPGALEAFQRNGQEPVEFLLRHVVGDWGDLEDEDRQENDFSVDRELRILSAYNLNDGTASGLSLKLIEAQQPCFCRRNISSPSVFSWVVCQEWCKIVSQASEAF